MKTAIETAGEAPSGDEVYFFRLMHDSGLSVGLTNIGATWVSAVAPASDGTPGDVLLGYDDVRDYLSDPFYMGATIGRFANRIAHAGFSIGKNEYRLEKNDGIHSNHGGFSGFHRKIWQWEEIEAGIRFTLHSPGGEGGYPGNLFVSVDYQLEDGPALSIRYRGITDAPTYLNLTNHAYFNLSGSATEDIGRHVLTIPATQILDTSSDFIPTGAFREVGGTVFDFTSPHAVGDCLHAAEEQLVWNRGYNHCYRLGEDRSCGMHPAACLFEPSGGRELSVETDLPGILLYTAGFLENTRIGKRGIPLAPHTGICLEAQFFPDTPHHPGFPSCLLNPGEVYDHRTRFTFRTKKGQTD